MSGDNIVREGLLTSGETGSASVAENRNAGLLAIRILGSSDEALMKKMILFQARLATESRAKNLKLQSDTQAGNKS